MSQEIKARAFDAISCLISEMNEGFHGCEWEMTEGLMNDHPEEFKKFVEEGNYKKIHEDPDLDLEDGPKNYERIAMSDIYQQAVFGMIERITDQIHIQVDNATQNLRISFKPLHIAAAQDMWNCLKHGEDPTLSDVFTREFFQLPEVE